MNKDEKINKSNIIIGLIIIVSILTFSIGYPIYQHINGNLINDYNPDEEGFWSCVSDDVLIYGIYDDYKFESGFNRTSYALLKNTILSIDDQGVDIDDYPDLMMDSHFLIGNEELSITLSQFFDFNLIMPLLQLLLGGTLGETSEDFVFPTLSSLHFVNSELITDLNKLSNMFFLSEELSTFSFEYDDLGTYENSYWDKMLRDGNNIDVVQLFEERNESKGLEFIVTNNSYPLLSDASALLSADDLEINQSGYVSFYYYPSDDNSAYIIWLYDYIGQSLPYQNNGIFIMINGTDVITYEGKREWFDNDIIEAWVDNFEYGNFTTIDSMNSDEWNFLSLQFDSNYTQPINLTINENEYQINFSIYDESSPYVVEQIMTGCGTGDLATNDSVMYMDDLTLFFGNETAVPDIPIFKLLSEMGLYSLFYFPKVFNFDAFYDFLRLLFRIVDKYIARLGIDTSFSLEDEFMNLLINQDDYFELRIESEWVSDLITTIADLFGFGDIVSNLYAVEGNITWYLSAKWDKYISCLNETILHINYHDIQCEREIGLNLIVTRSPEEFQDGYYYYNDTWFSSDYVQISRPFARMVSLLNNDSYPSRIPEEWDVFSIDKITDAFLNEFEYGSLIGRIYQENAWLIWGGIIGLIAISVGSSIGIEYLVEYIKKRRQR